MNSVLAWIIAIVVAAIALIGLNGLRGRMGVTLKAQTPAELAKLLKGSFRWIHPEGDGPFPVAVLLSGCDGPKSNLEDLADELRTAGWMSLIVDSHGPRGLDRNEAWRLVCAGQILNGAERAADLAVALSEIRKRPDADSDRIALIGFSHGGWTVLDFLALSTESSVPPLLTEWPENGGQPQTQGIRKIVLFYPYCGTASMSANAEVFAGPDYLFLLVSGDTIASDRPCLALSDRMRAEGASVEVEVFDGVTHSFDQEAKNLFSSLEFDPEATKRAYQKTVEFLSDE